jgi:hypothetical protein
MRTLNMKLNSIDLMEEVPKRKALEIPQKVWMN